MNLAGVLLYSKGRFFKMDYCPKRVEQLRGAESLD